MHDNSLKAWFIMRKLEKHAIFLINKLIIGFNLQIIILSLIWINQKYIIFVYHQIIHKVKVLLKHLINCPNFFVFAKDINKDEFIDKESIRDILL